MAHKEQQDFCLYVRDKFPKRFYESTVLDVGSLDINGNNRYLFLESKYTGIDIGEGKNVDIVSKGHEYNPGIQYDIVISTECFEHDMHYEETIKNCIKLTKDNGLFMFSCASTGRHEHGTARTTPQDSPFSHLVFNEYYKNLTEDDIRKILDIENTFSEFEFIYMPTTCDLYFYGIKKPLSTEALAKVDIEIITDKKITEVDVCIISYAKNEELLQTTRKGIESLLASEENIQFNIFVVESHNGIFYDEYPHTRTIHTDKLFNYNAYLNLAVKEGKAEYVVLCINDLTFEKRWASNIILQMKQHVNLLSASPACPQVPISNVYLDTMCYYGYEIRKQLNGWCIFQQREIYTIIGELDEEVEFWFSDNIYADQLINNGIVHGLIRDSIVHHHENNLGKTGSSVLTDKQIFDFTQDQYAKYLKAKQKYL